MRSFIRMSWLLIIFILSFTYYHLSEANLPSAVVVGTVYCDTCFQEDFSKTSHFISGASVAVECKDGSSKPSFRKETKTNEHGEFNVHLPFSVSKHVKKIKECSVKLISSSEPYCAVASTATSSSLHLKSRKQGTHIFSAGFFTFKPLQQPTLCNQKPRVPNSKDMSTMKDILPSPALPTSPSPIQNPIFPNLPPLPVLPTLPPLPQLPLLPPLPGFPNFPPMPEKTTQFKPTKPSKTSPLLNKKVAHPELFYPIPRIPPLLPSPPSVIGVPLPPNPLLPPPILPPNPFQPPSLLPPNPFQPPPLLPPNPFQPPPPLINFPPIPGLTPPSPPPFFPFPLPPLPFLPSPGVPGPGIPPASSSSSSKKTTP